MISIDNEEKKENESRHKGNFRKNECFRNKTAHTFLLQNTEICWKEEKDNE